jgi:nitronate monooxygenase
MPVELPLHILGADPDEKFVTQFDPKAFAQGKLPWLRRPKFLAIVASQTLVTMLLRKANGRVDGFVVEGPTAGGHNAPPRGKMNLNRQGEPVYGPRDNVDLDAIHSLGVPFWVAGSYGTPERVVDALNAGARGVQVGTAFAFCRESGLQEELKQRVIQMSLAGELDLFTDPLASPTGFPFKILRMDGTLSEPEEFEKRGRICDLGFLRQGYKKDDGTIGWRCPGEGTASFVRKGGDEKDVCGRKCICNGLVANIGLPQVRSNGEQELPLLTCGNEVTSIHRFLKTEDATSYSARDVITRLTSLVASNKRSPEHVG